MNRFNKILVPVDFSKHSAEAIRFAADLSRHYEASLSIVHVYQSIEYALPEAFPGYSPIDIERLMVSLNTQVESAIQDAHAAGALKVDGRVLQGIVSSEIVRFAKEGKYDLIVMGTHGRTGMTRFLLGSIAERVLRTSPCPVLSVHAEQTRT